MRCFAILATLCVVSFLNFAQTNKPKPKAQTAKPKATAKPAKKTTAAKPKPVVSPIKKPPTTNRPNEKAVWEKAVVTDPREARIAALQKFNETFPRSSRKNEALAMIAFLRTDTGNEKLAAGETDGAAAVFKLAATDAPKPMPEQLWIEALSKIAANLYFRGARESAIEIEKILESKADGNLGQLLDITNFYMMIENGGEARRVSLNAISLDPNSSVAYQTLGLANRIDFQLFGSASAYERALELDPTSLAAKRGLAEMKRALGKADESVQLYREILTADANNLPAQTGLILALFDANKRADAETELARSLEANPGNVILLAGAAYWYAGQNESVKAVDLAQKAIDKDPRFIWSHIALARGLLLQNKAADAEKTLLSARRYGNFPTLEYELASARLAAGYYREAAEGLRSVFKVTDGKVSTRLGGRVMRDGQDFTELVGDERRASIFAPTAADSGENAARLAALLEFEQLLDSPNNKAEDIAKAAEQFVKGGDRMKVYRQVFAATQLLEKKTALPKVLELTKSAASSVDDGLAAPNATIAVMAAELYESRAIAGTKGEYIVVPDVQRQTLSAVLRGRIEEIAGWAQYNLGSADEAIIRLRRAVGVLPADSAWWRSSTWRLGAAYALAGRDADALDMYLKSYKSAARPDSIRYGVIEALYRKVNGNTNGLDDKIGPHPTPPVARETVAQRVEPTPEPSPMPEVKREPPPDPPTPIPSIVPVATPTPQEIRPEPTPLPEVSATPEAAIATPSPTPLPEVSTTPEAAIATLSPTPLPEVSTTPEAAIATPSPTPLPEVFTTPEAAIATPSATPQPTPVSRTEASTRELFPPVIITIPAPSASKPAESEAKPEPSPSPTVTTEPTPAPTLAPTPTPTPTPPEPQPAAEDVRPRIVETRPEAPPEIKPCKITVSEETINLKAGGGDLAVIIGLDDDSEIEVITAITSSAQDVAIRREQIAGMKTRALFVLRSVSDRLGLYQVTFELPCGKRTIAIKVR